MSSGGTAWRVLALAAAVVDGFVVATYLLVIDAQGDESVTDPEILVWAAAMAVPGVLCALGAALPPRRARWLLVAAVPPAGGIGMLAIFSVGLGLLAVAGLALAAALTCLAVSSRTSPGPARRPVPTN